jgi:KaiC/GvpD/RAD55 family RecA-like ATPase
MTKESEGRQRCDFCRQPIPATPVERTVEDRTYRFCSETCNEAQADADRVFTRYHGHRRFDPGVAALDETLPQGCPRNSFCLLSGQAGTRGSAIIAELCWRALQRGEPAVYVTFREPPSAVVERFVTMDWNVLPAIEDGRFRIVDCFSHLQDGSDQVARKTSPWISHIASAVEPVTNVVRDPSDVSEIHHKIDSCLDQNDTVETGIVVIDSLTEFGTLVQPVQAYRFVKQLRASVPKGRFVPVFANATVTGDTDAFPHDLSYVADGVIDIQLDDQIIEDTLFKRIRVRKLDDVLVYPDWTTFEYTSGLGMLTFDPHEQLSAPDSDGEQPEEAGADADHPDQADDGIRDDDGQKAAPGGRPATGNVGPTGGDAESTADPDDGSS